MPTSDKPLLPGAREIAEALERQSGFIRAGRVVKEIEFSIAATIVSAALEEAGWGELLRAAKLAVAVGVLRPGTDAAFRAALKKLEAGK